MKKIINNLHLDKNNIWYLDGNFITKELAYKYEEEPRNLLFNVNELDDILIKQKNCFVPFYQKKIIRFLNNIYKVSDKLPFIDFPLGYYKENGKIKGIVIYKYENALSLKKFNNSYGLESLKKYYYHDDDEIHNLILLYLNILIIIEKMYDEGVIYYDIHRGNFLFYQNEIKLVDFEFKYVKFDKKTPKSYNEIINRYCQMINSFSSRLLLKNYFVLPGHTFDETRDRVKKIEKGIIKKW